MTESVVERAAEPAGERAEPDVPSPGPDFAPTQPIPARRFFVVEFPARVKNPDRAIACLGGPVKLGQTISASDAFHASREAAIGMAVPSSGLSLASLFPKLALAGPVDPAAGSGPATASAGPGEPRGMRADETPAASATAAATASGSGRAAEPVLELRWRPRDSFCHPVVGTIARPQDLALEVTYAQQVVRVTTRRRRRPRPPGAASASGPRAGRSAGGESQSEPAPAPEPEPQSAPGPEDEVVEVREEVRLHPVSCRVLGVVNAVGRFRSMADFQMVPDPHDYMTHLRAQINATSATDIVQIDLLSDLAPHSLNSHVTEPLPPPQFSRSDLPNPYGFAQNPSVASAIAQTVSASRPTSEFGAGPADFIDDLSAEVDQDGRTAAGSLERAAAFRAVTDMARSVLGEAGAADTARGLGIGGSEPGSRKRPHPDAASASGSDPREASLAKEDTSKLRTKELTAAATAASGISRRDLPELWVDFTAETIPTEPPNPHLAHWIASNLGSHGLETLRQLRQLFEERPIWLRKSLFGRLPRTDTRLFKQLISLVAYTFTRGPWKFCWVRFGYDPRKDPASRLYQRLELRDWEWRSHRGRGRGRGGAALAATLRAASHRAHSPVDEEMDDRIDAATSSAAEQLASLRHHPARVDDGPGALADGPGAPIDGPGVSTDDQAAPDSQTGGVVAIKGRGSPPAPPTEGPPDALILGPNTPSRQLQSAYQLCDITVESIRELINLSTVVRDTCDARTGWYIEEAYGMITKLCRMRITMGPAFAQETSVRDTLMLFQAAAAAASGAGGDIRASSSAGGLGSSSSSPGMPMTEATSPASGGILGSPADRADIEFPTFDEEEEDDEEEEEEDDDEEDDEEEEENDDDDDEGEEDGAAATTGSFLEPGASADAGARGSLTSGRALAGMGSMSLPAGLSGALWLASQGPPAAVPTDSAQTVSALQAASMAIQAGMPGSTSPVLADAPTFSSVAAAVKAATELGADGEDDDFRPYDVFGDDGDPDEEDSEEEEEDDEDDDSAMIF